MERLTCELIDAVSREHTRYELQDTYNKEESVLNAIEKLGRLENLEEQIGMPLLEFFSKVGKTREYMVTPNNKSFYPATLLGGTFRNDEVFVYCVLVHDVDNKMPFYDYFKKIYTCEETQKKLEEMKNEINI